MLTNNRSTKPSLTVYRRFGKRLLDLVLTIPALLLLSPLLGLLALLVRFKLGSPVLFRQQRPGRYGQPFTLLKFRTMANAHDRRGRLLPDADRLTPLGRFLRRSSLDELPELFSVLKGEMSLVGPRPLLMKYLNRYTPEQMRRQEVLPGLTGLAQVKGRNSLGWEERLELDCWYVDHRSLALDLKIILLTFRIVFRGEGTSHPGHATMVEFKGAPANGQQPHSPAQSADLGSRQNGPAVDEPRFSPEFKAQVVLDVISGVKRTQDICREHNLEPHLLARWQAEFMENAASAFQSGELRGPANQLR